MWNNYWTFLDYLELRRRIEKHLSRGIWLFSHATFFVMTTLVILVTMGGRYYGNYFVEPNAGYVMAFWSFLLAAHALFTYFRSGASSRQRSAAIEAEMRERVRNDDSYLSDNPKALFRVHGILEDDLHKRSSAIGLLTLYSIANAAMWIPWAIFTDLRDSFTWTMTPAIALLLMLPLLGFSAFSAGKRERALRQQMENLSENSREEAPKQKRFVESSHMRLTDDGELMMIEDDEIEVSRHKRR